MIDRLVSILMLFVLQVVSLETNPHSYRFPTNIIFFRERRLINCFVCMLLLFVLSVVAPLETIRTHLMVGSTGNKTVTGVFKWIMEKEGWQGLFRGNAINVLRIAPSKALEVRALAGQDTQQCVNGW